MNELSSSLKDRIKAFLIHLSISSVIAIMAMILVFRIWYPAPLHEVVDVGHIFYTLIFIDVTIGPILTLIVFNRKKPHLKFDMAVIVLLQISALGYGVWTVAQGRPAWIVFNVDRFDVVQAQDIGTKRLDQTASEYRNAPWFGPKWVYAEMPKDRNAMFRETLATGVDLPQRPDRYRPLEMASKEIIGHKIPLSKLKNFNQDSTVEDALRRWPQADAYLPLNSMANSAVVLINTKSMQTFEIIMLQPW